ncbi:MAG: sigma-54-dependent Fis family transcriptional regulator [Desulfovibrio sp.]|uniref:sigma-54-dependent transcriptional regulator n=1 Tax=Desulfovibrio sp. TaxID=885 RepID=UPI0025BC8C46|nr:sigma-54 dependent transcriptional regulator [Desulfovibrio sp.]MBS6829035.1 sigma-54-dependent Fis family transcriptional regulator [Desulfovibrio sp.]
MKKTLTILVADDDATHREVLRTLLEEWGYAVREAVDGEHAVALCREQPFDLVLMDVRMPKKSGLEALKEIKVHNPAVPVLIMTAFSDVAAAVEAIKSGAYDYLTKPLDFEKLKVVLRNVFAHVGLIRENATLSRSLAATEAQTGMVGRSESMRALWEMVRTIAPTDATVLITGESGTGKELVAKAVHAAGRRARGPFVAVNCAALTESLLASELFGHEKGAFTGADKKHEGHFLKADGGTIFLDEIGEMPLSMQVKLLRVIQEREVLSVGGNKAVPVDVRIIAATNRDLAREVAAGTFRQDLYYRLNVVTLALPPLRERADDIPLLAQYFMARFADKNNKKIKGFTPGAMDRLVRYAWPGNVRELENVIERASILLLGEHISERELPERFAPARGDALTDALTTDCPTLEDVERAVILKTLKRFGGNKTEAAKALGITRKTLHAKLSKYQSAQEDAPEGEDEDKGAATS